MVNLRHCFDELKNTWPNEFSLHGPPRAAQPYHDRKVHRSSINPHHLSPKAGEVLEDLPQQLGHNIADTLASIEMSSNSDFDDDYDNDYQGSTGFAKL
jgi:hypothetical protein